MGIYINKGNEGCDQFFQVHVSATPSVTDKQLILSAKRQYGRWAVKK